METKSPQTNRNRKQKLPLAVNIVLLATLILLPFLLFFALQSTQQGLSCVFFSLILLVMAVIVWFA